ncbi:VanW family protein [Candidatus Peregrinibacteria bacterium]|nr:VanW family protein [Candidatus Peregrinibacteria bacterium]
MRWIFKIIAALVFLSLPLAPALAFDVPNKITLKTDWAIWDVNPRYLDVISEYPKAVFRGLDVKIQPDEMEQVEPYLTKDVFPGVDLMKLKTYMEEKIAPQVFREKEDVAIRLDEENKVVFEGNGFYGRSLDSEKAASMLKYAIEHGVTFVSLPLARTEPAVTVLSDKLKEMGIKELYSSGETDFSGSSSSRINNIHVGLSRFDGHIVLPGEEFSFGNVLGPVDDRYGYKKELVIKGDRTVPEFGGGLCQVSSTAYRAVLAGGFPVKERRNHSYAVHYYSPAGLDATVYPPSPDLKFVNDSPAHILMQAFTIGNKAYYNFYGTRDARHVYMIGPYYSNYKEPPPKKTEYTQKLAPGEVQVLGHAVPGLSATWYRQVLYNTPDGKSFLETIFSKYEPRPDFVAVGASSSGQVPGEGTLENGY